jgi:hypothetical protein
MGNYWLLDWLDEEGVRGLRDSRRLLSTSAGLDRLVTRAEEVGNQEISRIPAAQDQIIAGSGFDLSGDLDCSDAECIKKRVTDVLYRTWHYFDTVVVTGLDANNIIGMIEGDWPKSEVIQTVLSHVDVAFYIRRTGAEKALTFSQKPYCCTTHIWHFARDAGLFGVDRQVRALTKKLKSSGKMIDCRPAENGVWCDITHPAIDTINVDLYEVDFPPNEAVVIEKWAGNYARSCIASLARDAAFARSNGATLGQRSAIAENLIPAKRRRPTASDVAFNLELPVVQYLPIKELLAMREHEATDFQAFRFALRQAIATRLESMHRVDAQQIAESVIDDVLEPALIGIDRKMNRAVELLTKRSAVSLSVGVALATVGLLTFAPIAGPGFILGAGAWAASHADYIKDQRDVKLNDMYFLWRLSERSLRHMDST